MPVVATPFPTEVIGNFLGLNLRQDGLSIADQEVMRAINADFHTQIGTLRSRLGRTVLNATNLGAPVRTLAQHVTRRYQVANTTLYRDWVSILTGLNSTTLLTTLLPYRPFNDPTTWSFIADPNLMRKDNGTTVYLWGVVGPAAAPVIAAGAAGTLSGDYGAVYTYARVDGTSVAHESSPSASPVAVALANEQLNVTVIASADPQVTNIRVYRTLTGGSRYFFDQQVANANAIIASSQADIDLGTEVEEDNSPPVEAAWCVEFQGHIFLCQDAANPHYLWYSKRFRPEAFPVDQFLEIGNPMDPLQAAVAMTGLLGVFTRETKYRVFGNSVSGFTYLQALNTRGTPAPQAVLPTSRGVGFVARDGLFLTNFVESDVELTKDIQRLFYGETVNDYAPIDWNSPKAMTLAEYKRRLYFGYQDTAGAMMLAVYSMDTQHWYHYEQPVYRLLYEELGDQLTMGSTDGLVYVIESGMTDAGTSIAVEGTLPLRAFSNSYSRKPFRWLSVDADAADAGWTIVIAVDGVDVLTTVLMGDRRRRFVPFPEDTLGYTWQARVSLTQGSTQASLYTLEVLDTGQHDGQVWLADPENVGAYLQIIPAPQPQDRYLLKRLRYLKLDAETFTGSWLAAVYLDDVLRYQTMITGSQNKALVRLPDRLVGYAWHVVLTYSSADVPQVYGVQVQAQELHPS